MVGNLEGQTTYDPVKIKELIGGRAWEHPSLYKNFGVHSAEEALHPSPAMQRLYDDVSAISMLTNDDPPVFMVYEEPEGPLRPTPVPAPAFIIRTSAGCSKDAWTHWELKASSSVSTAAMTCPSTISLR